MSDRMPKILEAMDDEQGRWFDLVGTLGEFEATRRSRDRWSPVDTLNHVTVWKQNAIEVARLQSVPDAPRPDPSLGSYPILGLGPDIDTYNARRMEERFDWTLEQSRAWAEEIHGELRRALEAVPPDRLIVPDGPHGIVGWLLLPAIEHPPEHRLRLERQLGYTP
jgi:hypothetical protein